MWSSCTNRHIRALKAHPWTALPPLLGKGADSIIGEMLLHCGLFESIANSSNLSQLSGVPLGDLKQVNLVQPTMKVPGPNKAGLDSTCSSKKAVFAQRGLSEIRFVHHRILYAKPILNGKGKVRFGLPRIHAMNRKNAIKDQLETVHIMKYIFPRQFGLHNVFNSNIDRYDVSQGFKDYTLRDAEIHRAEIIWRERRGIAEDQETALQKPLPKRLRGEIVSIVSRLRKRHTRCSYSALLDHYCPRPSAAQLEGSISQASSVTQMSAFCRAAVLNVFPTDLWGSGDTGLRNQRIIMHNVDKFVRLRRFENLSVHDVLQNITHEVIPWLSLTNGGSGSKMSRTDFEKRRELMAELAYYLLDSFLMPLIRGHFYVTESGTHRNQLFFFRQDVWKAISDPALASLKQTMLEPCNTPRVKRGLGRRELGVSRVRLLPKEHGMRPIINLRRRGQYVSSGRTKLGISINSLLKPAFSILNCEQANHAEMLASAMFSVEDIFPRLQAFRNTLASNRMLGKPLYFAKVDVKACFDTIPQKRLMQLARTILGSDVYHTASYARVKLVGGQRNGQPEFGANPSWRRLTKATAGGSKFDFAKEAEADTASGRNRIVYVDGVGQKAQQRQAILKLLEEHVESNLITLGNRLYRQKEGIPQGSIISSLLCSYFYSDLVRKALSFTTTGDSILLRLIDDFLIITTEKNIAERFMRVMHQGIPEFGVEVKAQKSRVNFDIEIDDIAMARLPAEADFPYCGKAINTVTLDLSTDKEQRKQSSKYFPDKMETAG